MVWRQISKVFAPWFINNFKIVKANFRFLMDKSKNAQWICQKCPMLLIKSKMSSTIPNISELTKNGKWHKKSVNAQIKSRSLPSVDQRTLNFHFYYKLKRKKKRKKHNILWSLTQEVLIERPIHSDGVATHSSLYKIPFLTEPIAREWMPCDIFVPMDQCCRYLYSFYFFFCILSVNLKVLFDYHSYHS